VNPVEQFGAGTTELVAAVDQQPQGLHIRVGVDATQIR
jgi:hypothetical protein